MEKLAQMLVFARVVEEGSFSKAAVALGYSRAAISKQIANLEREVGAQLLNRTTRRMSLTEIGAAFYDRCARIAEQVREAQDIVARMSGAPAGLLRIGCSRPLARCLIVPLLERVERELPEIRVEVILFNERPDVIAEEIDVFLELAATPPESSYAVQTLYETSLVVVAAPTLVDRLGAPAVPKDLLSWPCVTAARPAASSFRFPGESVKVTGPMSSNDADTLIDAALCGIGAAQLPELAVRSELTDGRLVRLFGDHERIPLGLFCQYPQSELVAPKVSAFVDFLTAYASSVLPPA